MLASFAAKAVNSSTPRLLMLGAAALLSLNLAAQPIPRDQLPAEALTIALDKPTPFSPKVTTGRLDNGLRYYIRENKEPKQRAELRLVVNTGSLQDPDGQRGLAHFLEHMAFNGTEHFPKQAIVDFMQSIGMKFGNDLNASTSFDETIYMLQVPTDKPEAVSTALQILEDWSHGVLLTQEDTDQERGVIIEEWRRGQGAGSRVRDKQLPVFLKDSRYAERLPIGTIEEIGHVDAAALKQFYQEWYRPELMAVIAVGDFDKADIEKQIRQHFAALPTAKVAKTHPQYNVPASAGTLFSIVSDPEVPSAQVALIQKLPPFTDWTTGGVRKRMMESFYDTMLSARFVEMGQKPDAPFLRAQSGHGSLVRPVGIYQLAASVQETGILRGLEAVLIEAERVKRFGFTQPEFDRVKVGIQRSIEAGWARRDNRTSSSYTGELASSFLVGSSPTEVDFATALSLRFLNDIKLDEINQLSKARMQEDNRLISVTMPQKAGLTLPTESELQAVVASVAKADIKPYLDTTNNAPLLSSKPAGSKVVTTREIKGGITEWILGNGIKVVVKPSDFKKDQIIFTAYSPGGTSLVSDADYPTASLATTLIASGGLGNFTSIDLQRKLTGKVAQASPVISDYLEQISGSASPADLETMFQLIYLRATAPRADANIFQVLKTQFAAALKNRSSNPAAVFEDTFERLLYDNHPRKQPPTPELLDQLDLDKALAIYKDRFGDDGDFTFLFAGDIDLKTFQPLVETYLGGLPTQGRKEKWKDLGIAFAQGVKEETIRHGLEPKSQTRLVFHGDIDYIDLFERTRWSAAALLLNNRLREVMREQLGATYNISHGRSIISIPRVTQQVTFNFGSAPERADELTKTIFAQIDKLATDGPSRSEIADIKAILLREYETNMRTNEYWLASLLASQGRDPELNVDGMLNFKASVQAVDAEGLREAYRKFFSKDNYVRLTMLPEK